MAKIYFAADHAGFELKKVLISHVRNLGYEVEDSGAHEYTEDDDYPDFVKIAAQKVADDPDTSKAVVIGGSGQGEAIVANRFKGVRAVVFNGQYRPLEEDREIPNEIALSREHNDANILSLGARFLNEEEAKQAVTLWLSTSFSNDERHVRRIRKIDEDSM